MPCTVGKVVYCSKAIERQVSVEIQLPLGSARPVPSPGAVSAWRDPASPVRGTESGGECPVNRANVHQLLNG